MSEKIFNDLNIFNELVNDLINDDQEKGVSDKIQTEDVLKKLDISLSENGIDDETFKNSLKEIILNTPKTSSKLFFNQLFGGLNSKSVVGELLAVILNNSMATYKIAGPMVEVEKEILRKVASLIDYPKTFGGTFPTGGSMCNFMALIIARDKKIPEIRNNGKQQDLVCYSSQNSHYSMGKNASFAGIGRNNVRYIETNEKGEMCSESLQTAIKNDLNNKLIPFFVNATVGTTVMGATDPISEIANICNKDNIWLHIDGAFAGTVIFSKKYKHLAEGVQYSDSFCFNAHKTLGTPLSTSILLTKDEQDLYRSFSNKAEYLYQTDNDDYNLGQTSFECGRRNNALKFWTLWKSVGANGIGEMVETNYSLSDIARNYIRNNSDYKLYSYDDSLSVCFNYKDFDAIELCTQLYNNNKLMVGYGEHKGETFVRLVTINRENTKKDILSFFKILEDFSNKHL